MFFRHGVVHGQASVGRTALEMGNDCGDKLRIFPEPGLMRRFALITGMLMLGIWSSSAFAQSGEAAAIKIGESNFIPTVRFDFLQTNNAFLTKTDQIEASAFVIKPRADWVADRRLLRLTGIYEGLYASYSEEALNYADHSLRAVVDADVSTRQRLRGRFAFNYSHQPLGTNFTRGTSNANSTQVEFLSTELAGSYSYGAQKARGNVTLGLNVTSREYQNQKNLTKGSDYVSIRPYGQFSLRLSADTRAIATVRFSNVTFDNSVRDRNDISLLAGLRFAATGKSGGEFQLGSSLTNFSKATQTDITSFIAEAELFYTPSVFSRFELSAARVLDNDAGSPLDSDTVLTITDTARLNWRHEWSSRLYHVADLSYRQENGDCPAKSTLGIGSGGIEMNLVLRRWLHVGASFRGQSRDTTLCENIDAGVGELGYESQTIGAHIRATL